MKKLTLELDALQVESFVAADPAGSFGTVLGQQRGPVKPQEPPQPISFGGHLYETCEVLGTCMYASCMGDCVSFGGQLGETCEILGTCMYVTCMGDACAPVGVPGGEGIATA